MTTLIPLQADAQHDLSILAGENIAVAQTAYGKVRGYIHQGVYVFKGIPYGRAARFMASENPTPWMDVRNSLAYGPACPNQLSKLDDEFEFAFQRNRLHESEENCLNLNIWSKEIIPAVKKPVMVWLHGGGFSSGSAIEFQAYDGKNLCTKGDVVVVSINHRLNVLGFLDLSAYGEQYKSSANAGAMDMVLALTWIKENITNFGGDPDNVTIFGQSGGGAKVICLMNAPSAKGLFHKAIVQSGSYLNHFLEKGTSKKVSEILLQELGLQPSDVDSLQKIPIDVLNAAGQAAIMKVQQMLKASEMPAFGLEWEPVRDGVFLPHQPYETAALELSKNVPLLIGSCKNEFAPFLPGSRNISMERAIIKLKEKYGNKTSAYMAAVMKAYPETSKPSDYIDVDFVFRKSVVELANQKKIPGAAPVFSYLFTWQSPVLDSAFKAFHCIDLPFVFNNVERSEEMTGGGQEAYDLARKVSEAWVQFSRTGNPNHKALPNWPEYTSDNGATMVFDNVCQVKNHHDKELLALGTSH